MILQSTIVLGLSAFIAEGFVRPTLRRYSAWKNDPNRVQVAGRDWRGRYVPDLKIKRIERALWIALGVIIVLGIAGLVTIFNQPIPALVDAPPAPAT